jgi:O-antigen ligase
MLTMWVILGAVVWLPVLFFEMGRRSFVVLLVWLFIAPVVANFVELRGRDFFEPQEQQQQVRSGSSSTTVFESERNRMNLLLAPNRLLFGAFALVFLAKALLKKRRLGPFDRTEKWMGVFAVILLVNLFSGFDWIGARVVSDAFLVPFLAYFVIRRLITSDDRLSIFIKVLAYMSVYLILMALLQGLLSDIERVRGPFGHRDLLYIVIVAVFFIVLSNHLSGGKLDQALPLWLRWFVVYLTPVVVLLTWTRGNWLGFAFAVWVFTALSFRLINFRKGMRRVALTAMLLPIVVVGLQEFTPTEFVQDRVANTHNVYARLAAWQAILNSALENPIFGLGLRGSREVLSLTVARLEGSRNLSSTHNSFLALFGDLGAVGFLAYMAIVWSMAGMGMTLYKRGLQPRDRWRGVAIVSMLAAYLLPAIFSNILFSPAISHCYVFGFVGAVAGLSGSRVRQRTAHNVRYVPAFDGTSMRRQTAQKTSLPEH